MDHQQSTARGWEKTTGSSYISGNMLSLKMVMYDTI
jgi:hypothetical protein